MNRSLSYSVRHSVMVFLSFEFCVRKLKLVCVTCEIVTGSSQAAPLSQVAGTSRRVVEQLAAPDPNQAHLLS